MAIKSSAKFVKNIGLILFALTKATLAHTTLLPLFHH